MRLFKAFCSNLVAQCDKLYILGDLFEYWVGDDGTVALGQDKVEHILKQLVDCGIEVSFMRGNRDFLVGQDFFQRTGIKELIEPSVIEINQKPILLCHGDALCTDDIEHQQARQVMLDPKWQKHVLLQPLQMRLEQANQMRQQSHKAKSTKSIEIMDVNQVAVEKLMLEHDVTMMIHGHTHRPAIHQFKLNMQTATRIVLGDWYTQSSILTFDKEGFRFLT